MVIAVAAHDALHAEHSRQAHEAEELLAKLAEQAEQFSDQCDDADKLVRATCRDRNAARRELQKLEANLPATPATPASSRCAVRRAVRSRLVNHNLVSGRCPTADGMPPNTRSAAGAFSHR